MRPPKTAKLETVTPQPANTQTDPIKPHTIDSPLPDDLSSKFNILITQTINSYENYINDQHQNHGNENKENMDMSISSGDGFESTGNSFDIFSSVLNKLLTNIRNAKGTEPLKFMNILREANINSLYEFASKLLQSHTCNLNVEQSEQKIVIVKRIIELLYVLVTNQNEDNEDYESSIMCCSQLSKSFNFTSSLCSLLLNYSPKPTNETKTSNLINSSASLLNEKSHRLAFIVLNTLTLDNPLFLIDSYVRQFIGLSVRKILDGSMQLTSIQFLSNSIRNNRLELKPILNSADNYYSFCRKLLEIVEQENNPNLTMNALIIVVILCFDDAFKVKSNSLGSEENYITQINTALLILCFRPEDDIRGNCKPGLEQTNYNLNQCTQKINSLNFLIEMFKMDKVLKTLEKNEGYSNLFLFKLNQLLIENGNHTKKNAQACTTNKISTKIFRILEILGNSSEKLSANLFQIIFNTRKFVEQKSSNNAYDLSKKLQELVLNSGTKKGVGKQQDDDYKILTDYYFKSIKLGSLPDAETTRYVENSHFYLGLFKYLNSLLKQNRIIDLSTEFEASIGQLLEILVDNFNQVHTWYGHSSQVGMENNEPFGEIYFYLISSIDILLNQFGASKLKDKDASLIKKLFDIVEMNKLRTPLAGRVQNKSWSMIKDNFVLADENILITCRLILRLVQNEDTKCDTELKNTILAFFKNENFLMLVSYGMLEANRPNLTATAYDLFTELYKPRNSESKPSYISYEKFLEINERLKTEQISFLSVSNVQQTKANLNMTQDFSSQSTKNSNANEALFDLYEKKIKEKSEQENQMSTMLNQYISRSLSLENELKLNRDKIREYSHTVAQLQKDMACFEVKNADLVRSNADLKISNSRVSEEKKQRDRDCTKLAEQIEMLKANFETEKEDIEVSITKLQEKVASDQVQMKKGLDKLNDCRLKFGEAEKIRVGLESRVSGMEDELVDKVKELDEKCVEYDRVKKELDKAKEILSYVKSNC